MPSSGCYASARRRPAQSGAVRTKMADATRHGLRITRLLPAPPQEVFAAWTDPACARHWMAPGAMTVAELEMDPRPGRPLRPGLRNERRASSPTRESRDVDP